MIQLLQLLVHGLWQEPTALLSWCKAVHTHTPAVFAGHMHRHALWQPLLSELQQVALCALCTDAAVTAAETKWSQENVGYVGRPVCGLGRRRHCNSNMASSNGRGNGSGMGNTACPSTRLRAAPLLRPSTPRIQAAQHMYLLLLGQQLAPQHIVVQPPHTHTPGLPSAPFSRVLPAAYMPQLPGVSVVDSLAVVRLLGSK